MKLGNISLIASRGLLIGKKYSPEILTVAGIAGFITAGILASKATLKLEDTVDRAGDRVRQANAAGDDRAVRKAKIQAATDLVKLYGPAVTMAALATVSVVSAHGIMRKRNIALLGAYKAIETSLSDYRKRVVEELGEDKDNEFANGYTLEEITDDDGKKRKILRKDPNQHSVYARFFDQTNRNWDKTPEYNLIFLKTQQNYFNDLLQARGHVFLNEVYSELGMEHSQAGAVVGWVLSKNGDNFVDFGIYDFDNYKARQFVNGDEGAILLDFNVDGVIFDLIP